MYLTIINDGDSQSIARAASRLGSLFNSSVTTFNVGKFADLSLAGNLIDIIDSYEDREGIIIANSAPRHDLAKKWENGTPFGYFRYKNLIISSTIDGNCLSLVKKLKLVSKIKVTDIKKVLNWAKEENEISDDMLINRIIKSQYRSFDYQPRLVKWIYDYGDVPNVELEIKDVIDLEPSIYWIDNYGNCKTTVLPEEFDFKPGEMVLTNFGELKCYNRMKDVPNREEALVIGSSGIDNKRFVEIISQGESASEKLGINIGDQIIFKKIINNQKNKNEQ
ncbi:MAG: hypothetical protein Q9M91_04950 [Candidatus Dojkabacteria bacterium]|nr:hypothetical protein [Candidatus Dojkabacteria bacterium]MDQ7021156.1 hypothetical protein [Candidatus Dojkabacteria bacterium]